MKELHIHFKGISNTSLAYGMVEIFCHSVTYSANNEPGNILGTYTRSFSTWSFHFNGKQRLKKYRDKYINMGF